MTFSARVLLPAIALCAALALPAFGADRVTTSNGMSEDCLYLNVWTPAQSDREKLPVLVCIFGGDPKRVTIAGESAGSISVSASM
jgi:carboxylesterase type B